MIGEVWDYTLKQQENMSSKVKDFVQKQGLTLEGTTEWTVSLEDEDVRIVATASRHRNVLKFFAVEPSRIGEGLLAKVLTPLITQAMQAGFPRLFLFTKPKYKAQFRPFGFYVLAETEDALLMENSSDGLDTYLREIRTLAPPQARKIGVIVANCNPFTLGHRYLIEEGSKRCDFLYVFILSSEESMFSASHRLALAQAGTVDLKNVVVLSSSDYFVSPATFPTYFLPNRDQIQQAGCALDLVLFCNRIAPALQISIRFVGTEPISALTDSYNMQMKEMLPAHGIEVVEIPRLKVGNQVISASLVRAYLASGEKEKLKELVPPSTYSLLEKM